MKGSERDSEQILANRIRSRSDLSDIYLKEPLKTIIEWIKEIELDSLNKYKSYDSRITQLEKDCARLDGKIRRIEKYAK